ncbi:DsbE family thiol:disulfide interchange protein [Ehrlichia sp. JZT12]
MKIIGTALLVCFLIFVTIFAKVLSNKNTSTDPSIRIVLPILYTENQIFDTDDLIGHPYIINVFASWCTTCQEEHNLWLEISKKKIIDIYGINYLDTEHKVQQWLKVHGNPYTQIAKDYSGKVANILGVTGVPETFVFNKNGKIILHIHGNISKDIWENQILQLVQNL